MHKILHGSRFLWMVQLHNSCHAFKFVFLMLVFVGFPHLDYVENWIREFFNNSYQFLPITVMFDVPETHHLSPRLFENSIKISWYFSEEIKVTITTYLKFPRPLSIPHNHQKNPSLLKVFAKFLCDHLEYVIAFILCKKKTWKNCKQFFLLKILLLPKYIFCMAGGKQY